MFIIVSVVRIVSMVMMMPVVVMVVIMPKIQRVTIEITNGRAFIL